MDFPWISQLLNRTERRAVWDDPGLSEELRNRQGSVEIAHVYIIWVNYNDLTATETWNHG